MLNLENIIIEADDNTWKDWFIVDEPKEKLKVAIMLDHQETFYVDPRFKNFKVTAISKTIIASCFRIWYIFYEGEPYQMESAIAHTQIIDPTTKLIEFFINR